MDRVSLSGNSHIIDENIHIKKLGYLRITPMVIGILSGIIIGAVSAIFRIPNFGSEGPDLLMRLLIGFDFGIIFAVIITFIVSFFVKKRNVVKYRERYIGKRYFVIINGSIEEIDLAQRILQENDEKIQNN